FNKQLSKKWAFLAGYSTDLAHENPYDPITPNDAMYNCSTRFSSSTATCYGPNAHPEWRQEIKMNGQYELPAGFMWGSTYTAQTGDWYGRTVQVRDALN